MESLCKNTQLILMFLKAPFLVLHFYYKLMTLLRMLSVMFFYADDTNLHFKCDQALDL